MLDALEQHAVSKLTGIDLGEIEWYHRLRNQLYHQGNGLTVERDKVTIYAELANTLFANLFGTRLVEEKESPSDILGTFLHAWRTLEANLASLNIRLGINLRPGGVLQTLRLLADKNVLDRPTVEEIQSLARIRNEVVHAQPGSQDLLNPEVVSRIQLQANNLAALERHASSAGAPLKSIQPPQKKPGYQ